MAKLGTHKRPAVVRVQSPEQAERVMEVCNEHGWQVMVGVEPDEPEDLSDLHRLLGAEESASSGIDSRATPRAGPGRNSPCPCGSGRRYKRCCAAAAGGGL